MLRCTLLRFVVFTQGYPALERFARDHFLPSNPLSSSCMWLDEDDFRSISMAAKARRVPFPLAIDPYAHHPVLSRFAQHAPSRETSKKKNSNKAHNTLETGSMPSSGKEQQGGVALQQRSGHSAQGTTGSPRRRRGRPPKSASPCVKPISAERVTEADMSTYQIPICAVIVSKPLYLFNLEQMYLEECSNWMLPAQLAEQGVRDGGGPQDGVSSAPFSFMHDYSSLSRQPFSSTNPLDSSGRGPTSTSFGDFSASPSSSMGEQIMRVPMFQRTMKPSNDALLLGIREVQKRFPNPAVTGSCVACGIQTRYKYGGSRQRDLQMLARKHHYRSAWWGTRRQWAALGVQPQPMQQEHVVPVTFQSKVVHISLIENAEEVLQRLNIMAHKRKVAYLFDDAGEGARDSAEDVMGAGVVMRESVTPGPHAPPLPSNSRQTRYEAVARMVQEDMRRMHYKLPLYLTINQLSAFGFSLRPNARGLVYDGSGRVYDDNDDGDGDEDGDESDDALKNKGAQPLFARSSDTAYQYWYHISQVHFPASYLLSSAVLSAEMEHPGVALHGTTGARLNSPELTYASLVDHHPEIAATLLTSKETSAAGAPAHATSTAATTTTMGMTAPPTPPCETAADNAVPALTTSSPACDGVEAAPMASEMSFPESAVAQFVSTHASPTKVRGRHLWFTAEDVLRANGIVDVNSAPVGIAEQPVRLRRVAGGSGDSEQAAKDAVGNAAEEERGGRALFNVEELSNPDDALRRLCMPFEAM